MGSRRDLYVGRAGQRVVMGELLYRGYNVAVPEADVGDDLLVVADGTGRMWRVQVKTSTLRGLKEAGAAKGQFWVPLEQLETAGRPELYYVLAGRWGEEAGGRGPEAVVGGGGAGGQGRRRMEDGRWRMAGLRANDQMPSTRSQTNLKSAMIKPEGRACAGGGWRRAGRGRGRRVDGLKSRRAGGAAGWWEYVVISRRALVGLRERRGFGTEYQGRMLVTVTFRAGSVRGYGVELEGYRNNWGRYWPVREVG